MSSPHCTECKTEADIQPDQQRFWLAHNYLMQAGRAVGADDVAFGLSHALFCIMCRRAGHLISQQEFDCLLNALDLAAENAHRELPRGYSREQLRLGITALAEMIFRWHRSDQSTSAVPRDHLLDVGAYARMLRNDMHNICLALSVVKRSRKNPRAWASHRALVNNTQPALLN